jgi:hypothetical protein
VTGGIEKSGRAREREGERGAVKKELRGRVYQSTPKTAYRTIYKLSQKQNGTTDEHRYTQIIKPKTLISRRFLSVFICG